MILEDAWAAYRANPDDEGAIAALVRILDADKAEIPPDIEERWLALQRRDAPEDEALKDAHVAVLLKQGKPVPPDLEEHSLRQMLARDPADEQAVRALVGLYLRTGRELPPDIEQQSLLIGLAERPGDPEMLRALAAVRAKLGTASAAPANPAQTAAAPRPDSAPPSDGKNLASRPAPSRSEAKSAARIRGTIEDALRDALMTRPSDTFLIAELLRELVAAGRIGPDMPTSALFEHLPPTVQVRETVLTALLKVAARDRS